MSKQKVRKSTFLNWFFSDKDDAQLMGNRVKNTLINSKDDTFTITTRDLFNECGYIPEHITVDYNKDSTDDPKEFSPGDCFLINDDEN